MAAQSITKKLGEDVMVTNFFCKDPQGDPCMGLTFRLNILSGDPDGLSLDSGSGIPTRILTKKAGTYAITITSTNIEGSLTTDGNGDKDGTTDTSVVLSIAPTTQGWGYA